MRIQGVPIKVALEHVLIKLEKIVCHDGCDTGVILLSNESPTHPEQHDGRIVHVYDHDFFSPLGDALIDLYRTIKAIQTELSDEPAATEPKTKLE